jgi:hypothetical protein
LESLVLVLLADIVVGEILVQSRRVVDGVDFDRQGAVVVSTLKSSIYAFFLLV